MATLALDYRSDRDTIFRSEFWNRVWTRLGTTLSLSTAHRHETAGQAERTIQELRKYFGIYTKDHKKWQNEVPLIEFAHNCATNSSTGCTPFELNYGFTPKDMNMYMAEFPPPPPLPSSSEPQRRRAAKDGDVWLEKMAQKVSRAKTALEKAHQEMKLQYDKHRRKTKDNGGNVTFAQVGTKVYLSTAGLKNISTISRDDNKRRTR